MVKKYQGKTKIMYLPVTTSTVMDDGDLVAWSSGYLIRATSTTAPTSIAGVVRKTVAATDSDYTTARLVPVEVPVEKNVVWTIDVTATLVAADLGLYQDLTNYDTVNRAASSYDVVQCVKLISTTKGLFILNTGAEGSGITGA